MKGSLHSDELMGAVVPSATGLRTGRRISHAFILDVPTYPRMLIVTAAAINISHGLKEHVDIIQTATVYSVCFILELPTYPRMLIVTDAAINISPGLKEKVDIIQNAIDVARVLGV